MSPTGTVAMEPAKDAKPVQVEPELSAGGSQAAAHVAIVDPEPSAGGSQAAHGVDVEPEPSAVPAHGRPDWPAAGELRSTATAAYPPAPRAVKIEDQIAAAVHRLMDHLPDRADIKRLQNSVPDPQRLLRCLEWMRARRERYASGDLLFSRVQYLCWQRDELFSSPFIDDERRAQQAAQRQRG